MAVSRKTNDAPTGANLDRLPKLAERWDARKSKSDDARSDLGTLAKEVEDLGFNRAAFKLTMKLRNMEAAKRADFLSSLNAYCDHLGVFAQADIFNDVPTSVGPDDTAGAIGAGEPTENVAHLQGEKAGKRGDRADANPYESDSTLGVAWAAGWQDGQAAAVKRNIKPLDPATETHASA